MIDTEARPEHGTDPEVALALRLCRRAIDERARDETTFREIAAYVAPWLYQAFAEGSEPPTIYDETAIVSASELVSRLAGGIFPDGVAWARFELPGGFPREGDDAASARRQLSFVALEVFAALENAGGRSELVDVLRDIVVFGTGAVRVERGPSYEPLSIEAIPVADLFLTSGTRERIGSIHVRVAMSDADIHRTYGVRLEDTGEPKHDRIRRVFRSFVHRPTGDWIEVHHLSPVDAATPGVAPGRRVLWGPAVRQECPIVVARWSTVPGRVWGVGPVHAALPAVRVVNEATRLILSHADLALAGMWMAEDDGVLDPSSVRLEPGAIVPIAPGSRGLVPLQPPSARLSLADLVIEEHRMAIRKALYAETVTTRTADTPPTALEIQQRMRELARQIGPAFGRIWRELAVPVLRRTVAVLVSLGRIDRELGAVARVVDAVPQSGLVRSARVDDVRRAIELASTVASVYGPDVVRAMFPPERFIAFAADGFDVPPELVPSPEELRATLQRLGAALGTAEAVRAAQPPAGEPTADFAAALRMIAGR